jgi:hypothetical protein
MPRPNDSGVSIASEQEDTYRKSAFYEQLVEQVFISEVLQTLWYRFRRTVEVLRSEVDAYGYDVVFECNEIVRHIQLKTSKPDAKTSRQNVNRALADKDGGCVVWIVRNEDMQNCRMGLSYLFFGGSVGQRLASLDGFEVAKHTRANVEGEKNPRTAIRVVPKGKFKPVSTTVELVEILFGLSETNGKNSPASVAESKPQ